MIPGGVPTHDCRLFLRLPARGDWRSLIEALPVTLDRDRPASVLLPPIGLGALDVAQEIVALIQRADVAALVRDDAAIAVRLKADGLYLAENRNCREARRSLGPDLALGVQCPLERHVAMQAGEDGADYLAFAVTAATEGCARDFLAWWRETMVLPSVALIEDSNIDTGRIESLADFLSPPC